MNILTFTTLYPNAVQPQHGIFVENRLRHLAASGRVDVRVVAPVPWFPFRAAAFGRYATFAKIPAGETRSGLDVLHPRSPVIPKIGMNVAPLLLYASVRPVIRRMMKSGFEIDLIDAHFFYPDGVAAVMLGRSLRKPVVVTARGTDINLYPSYVLPGRMIRWAADKAAGVITVSQALKDTLVDIGADPMRIHVLRNGVDLEMFRPVDRVAAGERLGLLSVGHLIPQKGHDLVIRALSQLPEATLVIVGEGPEEAALKTLANSLGLNSRVKFLGPIDHDRLHEVYGAADVLVLASSREGLPNVVLEAMACGTPVVASDIGGTREIVTAPAAGVLLSGRTPEAIAAAVRNLRASPPDRSETRAFAENFSWDRTTQGQLDLFGEILETPPGG